MSRCFRVSFLALGFSLLIGSGRALLAQAAEEQPADRGKRYGLAVGAALAGSPLGEVAGRYGLYAIPGYEFEVRAFRRSPRGHEWSMAVLWDAFRIDQRWDRTRSQAFDYSSVSLVVGYRSISNGPGVRLVHGVDAGWVHFATAADVVSFYTGEPDASKATGHAAVLAVSGGFEIPDGSATLVPQFRVALNFPDFGGGDGYSLLHREADIGLKALIGLAFKFRDLF
jgi:hypothetical protein